MKPTILETLASYAVSIHYDEIPTDVIRKLKLCILDALECCLSDMSDNRTKSAFESICKDSCLPATLFGMPQSATCEDAAFYNTVKGAITSRNDSSRTAICHPGSILIPTAFALGEECSASGKQIIEALLSGYEMMIRLGRTLVSARINKSWRNTALVAPFGAAFTASKILGLGEKETASAASFSCHFAGGVNEWAVAGTGEDVFQNGWGARNGILAARLAAAGADGCCSILEGSDGLLSALGASGQANRILDDLGDVFYTREIMHKPINCCFMVQGPSQAAKQLLDNAGIENLSSEQIRSVRIEVSGQAKNYPGCDNNHGISSLVNGIMSIQLGVASTLVNGNYDCIQWAPPIRQDIFDVMQKCVLVENEKMTASFPELQGAAITVEKTDGNIFSFTLPDVVPLSEEQVIEKFMNTLTKRFGEAHAKKLYNAVQSIENIRSISEITALLR